MPRASASNSGALARKSRPLVKKNAPVIGAAAEAAELLAPARLRRFRRRLVTWFQTHRRDLPWRRSRDPYRVWISEIMLQQTQVATVIPYFERFLAAFPNVESLAAAREEEVLRLWEGLGYYRRARQLHAAAARIVAEHGGEFPRSLDALRALPGVGRCTAGAIASIAYDLPAPILEANTVRLLARLVAYSGDVTSGAGQSLLWRVAESLVPARNPGELNQALMELGALVCTPREPRCEACPVAAHCAARRAKRERELPRPKTKIPATHLHEAAIVVRRGERIFVRQCGEGERWAGLWDFPRVAWTGRETEAHREWTMAVRELTGLQVRIGPHLATLKHGVTRYRITLHCHAAQWVSGRLAAKRGGPARWVSVAELDALPLSATGRKIGHLLLQSPANRSAIR